MPRPPLRPPFVSVCQSRPRTFWGPVNYATCVYSYVDRHIYHTEVLHAAWRTATVFHSGLDTSTCRLIPRAASSLPSARGNPRRLACLFLDNSRLGVRKPPSDTYPKVTSCVDETRAVSTARAFLVGCIALVVASNRFCFVDTYLDPNPYPITSAHHPDYDGSSPGGMGIWL